MKKIAVIGSSGRMGQEILSVLKETKVPVVEISEAKPASEKTLAGCGLAIDFSSPEGFSKALQHCLCQRHDGNFFGPTKRNQASRKKNSRSLGSQHEFGSGSSKKSDSSVYPFG
jgi:dihydrodipicolinate reductase